MPKILFLRQLVYLFLSTSNVKKINKSTTCSSLSLFDESNPFNAMTSKIEAGDCLDFQVRNQNFDRLLVPRAEN